MQSHILAKLGAKAREMKNSSFLQVPLFFFFLNSKVDKGKETLWPWLFVYLSNFDMMLWKSISENIQVTLRDRATYFHHVEYHDFENDL